MDTFAEELYQQELIDQQCQKLEDKILALNNQMHKTAMADFNDEDIPDRNEKWAKMNDEMKLFASQLNELYDRI
jgi:hypothetical protein